MVETVKIRQLGQKRALLTIDSPHACYGLMVILGVVAMFGFGCGGDLLLSARGLQVTPNPATSGETVVFRFVLTVVPEHDFAVVALIDEMEHASQTFTASISGPFDFVIGDAADLIDTHGLGDHAARVEVRLLDASETARSGAVPFQLASAP